MRSSHFGQVLQRRFLLEAQAVRVKTTNNTLTAYFIFNFMDSLVILAKISVTMTDQIAQIFLLLAGFSAWAISASPLLKYMIYAAEKDYRWPLAGWFLLITIAIFVMKFSLSSLIAWPTPGTWSSRLFYPVLLFAAYGVPFALEILRTLLSKKN